MNISNSIMTAISGGDALKQAVGIELLSKASDMQASSSSTLVQDFTKSQQLVTASATPHLGGNLDIRI
ncbi:YjfB family protein [Paenibacillus frigoriresistens]|uniref:YjfB family protein n=1 Tax=Paenibacillus alginolyticus TaxID=59839 RepID=UPI001566CB02|nr:YjfB family protein [Paenibacillus frigoriresistens]NRF92659.1 YjfB family protein [Paenibacillus frigoriresistens]